MSETRQLSFNIDDPQSLADCFNVIVEQTNGLVQGVEILTTVLGAAVALSAARPEVTLSQGLYVGIEAAEKAGRQSPLLETLRHALDLRGEFTPPPNPGRRLHIVSKKAA